MLTQALAIKLDLLNDVVAVGLRLPRQCVCDWRCGRGRGTVVGAIGSNTKLKLSYGLGLQLCTTAGLQRCHE